MIILRKLNTKTRAEVTKRMKTVMSQKQFTEKW